MQLCNSEDELCANGKNNVVRQYTAERYSTSPWGSDRYRFDYSS